MDRKTIITRPRAVIVRILLFFLIIVPVAINAQTRIKDIAHIKGLEHIRIQGLGLVAGLQGTGDGTQIIFTIQAMANLLKNFGITVDQNRLRQRNIAMVSVYADIPPFTKRGSFVDIVVSTLGDARSVEGGVLVKAPLYDSNGQLVAFAEGPVTIGGLNVQGAATQNYAAAGRVVSGAQILIDLQQSYESDNTISLNLNHPDFTTAFRVSNRINEVFGSNSARPIDPATVNVVIQPPYSESDRQVEFISLIEQLTVETDLSARVIINEKTGTVIAGQDVKLAPVLISHGGLTVAIRPPEGAPLAPVEGSVVILDHRTGNSVQDLAAALNALQVTPRDLIAIFQALKAHGALKADLIII